MTCSTGNAGCSFKMATTTFCDAPALNPNIVSAATASSCTSVSCDRNAVFSVISFVFIFHPPKSKPRAKNVSD